MSKLDTFRELLALARRRKKSWLVPTAVVLLLLGVLLVAAEASAIGPFLYTLF